MACSIFDDLLAQLGDQIAEGNDVRAAITVLCNNGGKMELGHLVAKLPKDHRERVKCSGALKFFRKHEDLFKIHKDAKKVVITATTNISFCDDQNCEERAKCKKLHVCKFWLRDCCKYGDKCKNDHGFQEEGNQETLQNHHFNELEEETLKKYLCLVLHRRTTEDQRVELNVASNSPKICTFYNAKECSKGEKCPFLHICIKYLVDGSCKYGPNCKRNHSLKTKHEVKIFRQFKLHKVPRKALLEILKSDSASYLLKQSRASTSGAADCGGGDFLDSLLALHVLHSLGIPFSFDSSDDDSDILDL